MLEFGIAMGIVLGAFTLMCVIDNLFGDKIIEFIREHERRSH